MLFLYLTFSQNELFCWHPPNMVNSFYVGINLNSWILILDVANLYSSSLIHAQVVILWAFFIWLLILFDMTRLIFLGSLLSIYRGFAGSSCTLSALDLKSAISFRKSGSLGWSLLLFWLLPFSGQNLEMYVLFLW